MRLSLLSALAVSIAAALDAPNGNKELEYKDFAEDMLYWGYSWEPIKVKTDDGFILTTFRIKNRIGHSEERDPALNPVFIMNGLACDAEGWVGIGERDFKPWVLRLFDRGFDVYLGNNRGTKYAQEHESLTIEDPEYWHFSWAEMGSQDDVKNIEMIRERTGKMVSYVGASQGTVQMFYVLATMQDWAKDKVFTFAATDPCTIAISEGERIYKEGLFKFQDYGVEVFGGPDQDKNSKTICDNFDQEICDWYNSYGGGEPISTQTQIHWAQNALENRFQEYAPNYTFGETQTDLIDLSKITHTPVTIWSGLNDDVCANSMAHTISKEIGERNTFFITVPWGDHYWWGGISLTDGLYKMLEARLIDPEMRPYPHDKPSEEKFLANN